MVPGIAVWRPWRHTFVPVWYEIFSLSHPGSKSRRYAVHFETAPQLVTLSAYWVPFFGSPNQSHDAFLKAKWMEQKIIFKRKFIFQMRANNEFRSILGEARAPGSLIARSGAAIADAEDEPPTSRWRVERLQGGAGRSAVAGAPARGLEPARSPSPPVCASARLSCLASAFAVAEPTTSPT